MKLKLVLALLSLTQTFVNYSQVFNKVTYLGKILGYSSYIVKECYPPIYITFLYDAKKNFLDAVHTRGKTLSEQELIEKLKFILNNQKVDTK